MPASSPTLRGLSVQKQRLGEVFLCVKLPHEDPRRLRYLPTLLRQRLLRAQVHFADLRTELSGDGVDRRGHTETPGAAQSGSDLTLVPRWGTPTQLMKKR